jgi:hypothetical protein
VAFEREEFLDSWVGFRVRIRALLLAWRLQAKNLPAPIDPQGMKIVLAGAGDPQSTRHNKSPSNPMTD